MNIDERKQEIIDTIAMLQEKSGKPCRQAGCGIAWNGSCYVGECRVKSGMTCQISDLAHQYKVLRTTAGERMLEADKGIR